MAEIVGYEDDQTIYLKMDKKEAGAVQALLGALLSDSLMVDSLYNCLHEFVGFGDENYQLTDEFGANINGIQLSPPR